MSNLPISNMLVMRVAPSIGPHFARIVTGRTESRWFPRRDKKFATLRRMALQLLTHSLPALILQNARTPVKIDVVSSRR